MRSKWTIEKLKSIAEQYKTRSDLMRGSYAAYQAAKRLGVMEDICPHMPKRVNRSGENNPRFKWSIEKAKAEALKYRIISDFILYSYGAYKALKRFGVLNESCQHMEKQKLNGENNPNAKWTREKLQVVADKYGSKSEFMNKDSAAYSSAYRMGILDDICVKMPNSNKHWDYDSIKENSQKYLFRSDFEYFNHAASSAARRMGIYDEVCSHMFPASSESTPERELASLIRESFPTATKLRKRKICIDGKPHVYGLDIDIYVPELNRGIEFDGSYHHSLAGLLRSKRHWPLEDVANYHQIKDRYFKSIGIRILHIKEKDWIKNKGKCLEKCLIFFKKIMES